MVVMYDTELKATVGFLSLDRLGSLVFLPSPLFKVLY